MTTDKIAVAALVALQLAIRRGEPKPVCDALSQDATRAVKAAMRQGYDRDAMLLAMAEELGDAPDAFQTCALPEPPVSMGCYRGKGGPLGLMPLLSKS